MVSALYLLPALGSRALEDVRGNTSPQSGASQSAANRSLWMRSFDQSEASLSCEEVTESGLILAHLHGMLRWATLNVIVKLILVLPRPADKYEPWHLREPTIIHTDPPFT